MAYACRYGHQRIPDILDLGSYELNLFIGALSDIVGDENGPARG